MIIDHGLFTQHPGGDAVNAAGVIWREHVNARVTFDALGNVLALREPGAEASVVGNRLFLEVGDDGVVRFVSDDPSRLVPIDRRVIETDATVSVGMIFAGGVFQPAPPVSSVPAEVTMRQAKVSLLRAGYLAAADAAIASLGGEAGDEARIEWEYAATLRRDHPLVQALGAGLGLTTAQIDALFVAAAAI